MHVALGLTARQVRDDCGSRDARRRRAHRVLLAYQPVGPAVGRLLRLPETIPGVTFRAVVDKKDAARALSGAFSDAESTIDLPVDLDVGMHRTGIAPERATPLYRLWAALPGVTPGGLHAYDGHLRDPDLTVRRAAGRRGPLPRCAGCETRCRRKGSGCRGSSWAARPRCRAMRCARNRTWSWVPEPSSSGTPATRRACRTWTSCTRLSC